MAPATRAGGQSLGKRRGRSLGAWTRARAVLRRAFETEDGSTQVEIGRVVKIGHGTYRDAYVTHVDFVPDPSQRSGRYAVLLPRENAPAALDERTRREVAVLEKLMGLDLPFRVPQGVAAVEDDGRLALVRRFRDGFTLDMRGERQRGLEPWRVIGGLAAAVHGLDVAVFSDVLSGAATRREHAEASLRVFEQMEETAAREALAWAREHLPPDTPAVCLHGDLVGDNVLLMPDQQPLVIDWEYAQLGDPAYDLARVTRGGRQPFKRDDGLQRLVDAYAACGGVPEVDAAHVRLHELCFAGRRHLRESASNEREDGDAGLAQLRDILDRAPK